MEHIDFFNEIQNHLNNELPFVIYKKPTSTGIRGFLQQSSHLRTNKDFDKIGFVFSPFVENKHQKVWMYEDECKLIDTRFSVREFNSIRNTDVESISDKEKHISIVEKAVNLLKTEKLKKVVISRSEIKEIEDFSPLESFKNIVSLYKNAFCYCWYHPKIGMWLGASPETLILLKGNSFETMALAGTKLFAGKSKITWGEKEKEEQELVVDSIIKGLKPITEFVKKGDTVTQKAGSLLHLKTQIKGKLKALKDLKVLVEELHPTSAVCGIPKNKSKEFILDNEKYDRSYYTGFLGCFSKEKETHLFVNLRCMQVHENAVQIYVGGGITAQSDAESEWKETVNKSQIMKVIL